MLLFLLLQLLEEGVLTLHLNHCWLLGLLILLFLYMLILLLYELEYSVDSCLLLLETSWGDVILDIFVLLGVGLLPSVRLLLKIDLLFDGIVAFCRRFGG